MNDFTEEGQYIIAAVAVGRKSTRLLRLERLLNFPSPVLAQGSGSTVARMLRIVQSFFPGIFLWRQ
jgi:hypothetical protein